MKYLHRTILCVLAIFVFSLSTAGEHVNDALALKARVITEAPDESDETQPEGHAISIDIFNSVLHVTHLVFHSDLIFEFTLPEITETKAHSVFDSALNFTKYYKTLFQLIISPNGP